MEEKEQEAATDTKWFGISIRAIWRNPSCPVRTRWFRRYQEETTPPGSCRPDRLQ